MSTIWRIGSLEAARQVLRARHATTQAGFTAEAIPQGRLKLRPILISDGPRHDEQRSKVARYFAPTVVEQRHVGHMTASATRLLDEVSAQRGVSLEQVALLYSVEVTAQVVGLTDSPVPAMARRLENFFTQPPFDITRDDLGRSRSDWARAARNGLRPVVTFGWCDVRPAVRARRKRPTDDVISHLISEGYSFADILVECVTYGTAGMVTTREFIVMAVWWLLTDDDLRAQYEAADSAGRRAVLHELMRFEPVVGHLYRRATDDITITDGDGDETFTIEAGDLIDIAIEPSNADPIALGADAHDVCPGRSMPPGVRPSGLSFGDGAHRCPGQPLAMIESEVFVSALLDRSPRLVAAPTVQVDQLTAGYLLRGMLVDFAAH